MDVHLKKLDKVCRLCSNYILKQKTPILATAYSDTIFKVFGHDVATDDPAVDPPHLCVICKDKLRHITRAGKY